MKYGLTSVLIFLINIIIPGGIMLGMGMFTYGGVMFAAEYNSGLEKSLFDWWAIIALFITCWSLNVLLAVELVKWGRDELVPRLTPKVRRVLLVSLGVTMMVVGFFLLTMTIFTIPVE